MRNYLKTLILTLCAAPFAASASDALKLTPMQEYVTKQGGTETPYQNDYWNNHAPGIYVDIITGKPLFSSTDKFDSDTGWPAFTRPIDDSLVSKREDHSLGMERTEVKSATSGAHLGHVFNDGPKGAPRYCINSASLRFVPKDELAKQGYEKYMPLFDKPTGQGH